jgi:antitoxin VapB
MSAKKKSRTYGPPRAKPKSVRETRRSAVESDADSGVKKASLFMNGRSQAVRLPKEFRFTGDHVLAMRDGDRIILMPHDDRMERLMAAFGAAPDFPDRLTETPQERPALDELFK